MRVHAFAADALGAALRPFDYELPELSPYEVDVTVSHCGICHSDVHLIDNDWGISRYPLVPGHEIVGTVAATGSAVEQLRVGERVGIGWQSGSCLRCEWCVNGYENLCRRKALTCVGRHGGFADVVRTDSRFAFPIPERLDSAGAAPLMCAGVTVYAPMRRYGVRPHHHVGVVGIGGLGHLTLQFAHAMGCEVTAFSTSPGKREEAASFGADHFVVSRDPAQMRAVANNLDFIVATASAALPWTNYLEALRPNGTLALVSLPFRDEGDVVSVPASLLVTGQKSVRGSMTGGRAITQEVLAFAARHNIAAKTEIFAFAHVDDGVARVRSHAARYRVVLEHDATSPFSGDAEGAND
ncbi:MAG TPA: NAD(P)-dependent alcohol dehydrogenase [Candidatus Bathyarchaeia archaeon]|nr:NAD(P)-dependent alcohol dehydrogenase [Candidatus Bathyarchaeia archaeon]